VDMFKKADIPKRLIPGTIALGAFTYTMDALPGSPQIQNIIPTTFFKTDTWAAPWLGVIGGIFVFVLGLAYLESRKRSAKKNGEGYGQGHIHEPMETVSGPLPSIWLALTPLVLVVALNKLFTPLILKFYSDTASVQFAGMDHAISLPVSSVASVWSITLALLVAILFIFISSYKLFVQKFTGESKAAIAGALLAAMNTATEYGFGAVIAALPGFLLVKETLQSIPNVLVNAAVTVTTLAGITGSASGGLSIALAAMSDYFVQMAQANQIPLEVLHRISSMASGGMDTLPHNGAVITLLTVTGLTHRQSYKDIFMITCLKTIAVFFVIAVYYGTGIV